MKRSIFLSFLFCLASLISLSDVYAQNFSYAGFQGGMSVSRMPFSYDRLTFTPAPIELDSAGNEISTGIGEYGSENYKSNGRWLVGPTVGVFAGKEFTKSIGLRLEMNYTQMGRTDTINFNQRKTFKAHYFTFDPMLQVNLTPNSANKFYIVAGPSLRLLAGTKGDLGAAQTIKITTPKVTFADSLTNLVDFFADSVSSIPALPTASAIKFKQYDLGINFGLSYMVQLTPYLYMNLGVRGYYGLLNIDSYEDTGELTYDTYATDLNFIRESYATAVASADPANSDASISAMRAASERSAELAEKSKSGLKVNRKLTNYGLMFQVGFCVPLRPKSPKLIKVK